jgi:hypothetical protein
MCDVVYGRVLGSPVVISFSLQSIPPSSPSFRHINTTLHRHKHELLQQIVQLESWHPSSPVFSYSFLSLFNDAVVIETVERL